MIVWGGYNGSSYLNTGGVFDPIANTWTPVAASNAPAVRYEHTAVWTGSEMVIWGGFGGSWIASGSAFNPNTESWSNLGGTPPSARYYHTALWTGSLMIVWGGSGGGFPTNNGDGKAWNGSWFDLNALQTLYLYKKP
jgi:hypothetical protein